MFKLPGLDKPAISHLSISTAQRFITIFILAWLSVSGVNLLYAAEKLLQPGEAFVTQFSGTKIEAEARIIDIDGIVGSIIDLRNPVHRQPCKSG